MRFLQWLLRPRLETAHEWQMLCITGYDSTLKGEITKFYSVRYYGLGDTDGSGWCPG